MCMLKRNIVSRMWNAPFSFSFLALFRLVAAVRALRHDIHHPSWSCLFDLLSVIENFLFYSPLTPSAVPAASGGTGKDAASMTYSPGEALFRSMQRATDSGSKSLTRRTASANAGSGDLPWHGVGATLARPRDTRRFKSVGVHVAAGVCEDVTLAERVKQLLEGLRLHELDEAIDDNAQLGDKSVDRNTAHETTSHPSTTYFSLSPLRICSFSVDHQGSTEEAEEARTV